jgi:hypothetical protein
VLVLFYGVLLLAGSLAFRIVPPFLASLGWAAVFEIVLERGCPWTASLTLLARGFALITALPAHAAAIAISAWLWPCGQH